MLSVFKNQFLPHKKHVFITKIYLTMLFSEIISVCSEKLWTIPRILAGGTDNLIVRSPMVLYVPQMLTLNNSAFCPYNAFVCFVRIWERTAIISLYNINWLVYIAETECVYCAVRTGYLNVIWVIRFIWIWEHTAIISLYSINWLVCITETECLLRGTDWVFKCNLGYMLYMDLRTRSDYFPIQH